MQASDKRTAITERLRYLDAEAAHLNNQIELAKQVRREADCWVVYRSELGKRTRLNDVVIPPNLVAQDLATYLDDIFHEFAKPGENVEVMPD